MSIPVSKEIIEPDEIATVYSWGFMTAGIEIHEYTLQKMDVKMLDGETCERHFLKSPNQRKFFFPALQMCGIPVLEYQKITWVIKSIILGTKKIKGSILFGF